MAFGAKDVQTAGLDNLLVSQLPGLTQFRLRDVIQLTSGFELCLEVATQYNIGAASRHVGCDSNHTGTTSLGNNLRFLFVVLGIENLVLDFGLAKSLSKLLRCFY